MENNQGHTYIYIIALWQTKAIFAVIYINVFIFVIVTKCWMKPNNPHAETSHNQFKLIYYKQAK